MTDRGWLNRLTAWPVMMAAVIGVIGLLASFNAGMHEGWFSTVACQRYHHTCWMATPMTALLLSLGYMIYVPWMVNQIER